MILTLVGCLDEIFEAPYILTAGLGEATSLTLDQGALRVATRRGVVVVDGSGRPGPPGEPADKVDGPYTLAGGVLTARARRIEVAGGRDLLARADGVWVLFADRMEWFGDDGGRDTIKDLPCGDAVATGPGTRPLVLCHDRLYDAVHPSPPLATGLDRPRAVATGPGERVYLVQGEPPQLYRLDPGGLVLIARFLGDVQDIAFGTGGLLPVENVYLLRAEGQVDYLRPP